MSLTTTLPDIPGDLLVRNGSRGLAMRLHRLCDEPDIRPTFWDLRLEAERRGLVETYDPRAHAERRVRSRAGRRGR